MVVDGYIAWKAESKCSTAGVEINCPKSCVATEHLGQCTQP